MRISSTIQIELDATILKDIAAELVRRNDLSEVDAIVYTQVTRGATPRLHAFPAEGTPPTVYAFARRFQLPIGMIRDGTGIITVPDIRWTRCDNLLSGGDYIITLYKYHIKLTARVSILYSLQQHTASIMISHNELEQE